MCKISIQKHNKLPHNKDLRLLVYQTRESYVLSKGFQLLPVSCKHIKGKKREYRKKMLRFTFICAE